MRGQKQKWRPECNHHIDRNRNSSWRIEEELNKSRILDKPKKELYLRDEQRERLPKKNTKNKKKKPQAKMVQAAIGELGQCYFGIQRS